MIIGFCGLAGAGKDTTANFIQELYPNKFERLAFADILKDIVSIAFGWDRKLLQGDTEESRKFREIKDDFWDITPRLALQKVGTECFRNIIDNNFWVKALQKKILDNPTKNYLITDVRFPNEVAVIKLLGGQVWRVQRSPNNPEWWEIATKANGYGCLNEQEQETAQSMMKNLYSHVHTSEWALAGFHDIDKIVENYGTLDDLKSLVNKYHLKFQNSLL